MRPCTNCHSTDTGALPTGILPKLATIFGSSPQFVAYVCRVCRHVDVWLDEEAALPEESAPAHAEMIAPA